MGGMTARISFTGNTEMAFVSVLALLILHKRNVCAMLKHTC